MSTDDLREIAVNPDTKPEPAGGVNNLRSAFESPVMPSACTVLRTY